MSAQVRTTTPAPAVVSLLQDVLRKVEASVLVQIQDHVHTDRTKYHPQNDGIDYLDTKNTLLLSYMIDLVVHLRNYFVQLKTQQNGGADNLSLSPPDPSHGIFIQNNETRLMEMKVLLDKISTGLDRKLRYQIDKVLWSTTTAASTNPSSTFAQRTDPLQFRPGILPHEPQQHGTTRSDDDYDDDDDDDDDGDDLEEDEDYKAARQTIRMASVTTKNTPKKSLTGRNHHDDEEEEEGPADGSSHLYRAPRFMSTPYPNEKHQNNSDFPNDVDDDHDQDAPILRRKDERQAQKLRNSEIVQTLREQLNDHRPEQDDIVGTGTTRAVTTSREQQKFRQAQREKLQFEEDYMIRLPRTKTERKQEQLYQRQREQNTISSITNDLHHITGSHLHHHNRSSSHQRPSQPPSDSKRKGVPKNSLQAALFGGGDSSNKKKKKR